MGLCEWFQKTFMPQSKAKHDTRVIKDTVQHAQEQVLKDALVAADIQRSEAVNNLLRAAGASRAVGSYADMLEKLAHDIDRRERAALIHGAKTRKGTTQA